jgi:predicted RNA-binding Zn-ribbon protein involved in translation (DUF1610 family)
VRTIQAGQRERSSSRPVPRIGCASRVGAMEPVMHYTCPVCGYPELNEPPRSSSGGGSYEICPSCGFEFGYTDDDLGFSYEQWRQRWTQQGMKWRSTSRTPPPGWDPEAQLQRLLRGSALGSLGRSAEVRRLWPPKATPSSPNPPDTKTLPKTATKRTPRIMGHPLTYPVTPTS